MENLQLLNGTLNRGFTGNVIYNFCLEHVYKKLYICLTYDKEKVSEPDDALRDKIADAYEKHFEQSLKEEQYVHILNSIKTEIQLAVFINGDFAGNVHKPGRKKEIILGENESSYGCLPCKDMQGMIKIVVNVFNVAENQTAYTLEIKGEK